MHLFRNVWTAETAQRVLACSEPNARSGFFLPAAECPDCSGEERSAAVLRTQSLPPGKADLEVYRALDPRWQTGDSKRVGTGSCGTAVPEVLRKNADRCFASASSPEEEAASQDGVLPGHQHAV